MKFFNKARETLPIRYYISWIDDNNWHYRLFNIFKESRKGYTTFYSFIGKYKLKKHSIRNDANKHLASQIHSEKIFNNSKYKGISYGRKRYRIGRFNISNNCYDERL